VVSAALALDQRRVLIFVIVLITLLEVVEVKARSSNRSPLLILMLAVVKFLQTLVLYFSANNGWESNLVVVLLFELRLGEIVLDWRFLLRSLLLLNFLQNFGLFKYFFHSLSLFRPL
jgi:hypothetical protein